MTRHYIIPIFVPHFGCPHDCVFCNQKRITGLSTNVRPDEVEEIIEKHLTTFKAGANIEVAFYGGSFTAIELYIQKELLEVPFRFKREGKIHGIRLSTRPDAIDGQILDNLKKYGVDVIELGVQSLDNQVLLESGRGHDDKQVYESAKMIKDYGFKLGLQMMVGLPKDSLEKSLYTCREFIKLDPYCVRIYPTLVIKDTYLEDLYRRNRYSPISLEEAIKISSVLLMEFEINNINVIRLGLQVTENIQLGKDVIAGPLHPAFRQLVEANIFKDLFHKYLKDMDKEFLGKDLVIYASNRKISEIAGQKSENINYFKEKYKFRKIKIMAKNLKNEEIEIHIGDFYDKINIRSLMKKHLQYFKDALTIRGV